MNDGLERRLAARSGERLTAPPALLAEAFPIPPAVERPARAPLVVTGLAAAASAAAPLVSVRAVTGIDAQAAAVATDLARALEEASR